MDWLHNNCVVVGSATDGNDGLEKIKELKPQIVITDIRMPFKDGIIMLEEALDAHDFETIIISGYSEFEYAKRAISLGVSEYILKPIDFKQLDLAIEKLRRKIDARQHQEKKHESLHMYREVLDVEGLSVHSSYVTALLDYIKENYPQRVSLSDLSEELQVSNVYLNAKFKEETNYTFNDFLNRYRMIKAIEFMKTSDKLIYEIAELVGFKDYKYFSQVFKKYVGYSPTHFTK